MYDTNLDKLCTDHEKIIEQILEEEEQLISDHRTHIDEVVKVTKEEMSLLNEVDKPGSDVQEYVSNLDKVFVGKIEMIEKLRIQLLTFQKHLKTEERMSKLYEN